MKYFFLGTLLLCCTNTYSLPSIDIAGLIDDGKQSGSLACLVGTTCLVTSHITPVCHPCTAGAANVYLARSASQCCFNSPSIIPSTPGEITSTTIAGLLPCCIQQNTLWNALIGCYSAPSCGLWLDTLYKRRSLIHQKITKYFSRA